MDADYPAFETPLCGELKRLCRRVKETYKEIREDLTPYKDDRYYRLAPMRLYTLSKRHFVLVFVVFFICFGLTVFIGIAGPSVIESTAVTAKLNNLKMKPFKLKSKPLSTYNQQLWLTCVIQLDQPNESSFKTNVTMTVKIRGVEENGSSSFINNQVYNRTRILNCAQKCAEIIVVHLGYLTYTQYEVIVGFEDLNKLMYPIKNLNFTWKAYNPSFSQVEIWFRFVFVVLTFMVTCLFAHSLRKFSMRDWGIEQKWMSILLPLLLLYNDPFFPLSFLVNSWFPGMLDDLFQSVFLCALLLFWLCVYHGIRVQISCFIYSSARVGKLWPAGRIQPLRALDLAHKIATLWCRGPHGSSGSSQHRVPEGGRGQRAPHAALACGYLPLQLPVGWKWGPWPMGASGEVPTGKGSARSLLPSLPAGMWCWPLPGVVWGQGRQAGSLPWPRCTPLPPQSRSGKRCWAGA
ncbi:transmembrane protein 181 isoform 5-T5 [Macrochelys suwanniensis]